MTQRYDKWCEMIVYILEKESENFIHCDSYNIFSKQTTNVTTPSGAKKKLMGKFFPFD